MKKNQIGVFCPTPEIWQECKYILDKAGEPTRYLESWNKHYLYISRPFSLWTNVTHLEYEKELNLKEFRDFFENLNINIEN